ncbi:MAG: DUF2911 domain-containing protein [Bacteroidota bacterium]
MKRVVVYTIGLFCAAVLIGENLLAQVPQSPPLPTLRVPRASQGAKVTQVVGLSEVTIFYHRPGVKGRAIWGGLLPYGEVWRAGANEPTLFTFSDEVTIAGKKLPGGTYRFLTIPGEKEWTVIFNSEVKNWGTVYEAKYDTIRFTVTPQTGLHEEWLSYSFTDLGPTSATVVLAWEKVRIPFTIEFNLLPRLQASVGSWGVLNAAARFALDNKVHLAEAMGWVDRSLALNKNFNNLRTKAELLAMDGKTKEAVAAAEEGLKIIKAMDQSRLSDFQLQQIVDVEKAVAEWKKKR